MRALLDGQPIEPRTVSIDDIAFDRGGNGPRQVALYLDDADLLAVGAALHRYVEDAEAAEPDFFEDELMKDVPVPLSADFLARNPELISIYFDEPFWTREILLAVLDAAGSQGYPAPASCRIVRFVGMSERADGTVELSFEAV